MRHRWSTPPAHRAVSHRIVRTITALAVVVAPVFIAPAVQAAPNPSGFVASPGRAAPAAAAPSASVMPLSPMADPRTSMDPDAAVAAAVRAAMTSGHPTPVPSETTETQTVTANPSGTVTVSTNVLPVRVRRGGAWTPIDTTLRPSTDGDYAPAATWGDLRLSGGGSGAFATLGSGASGLSLTWPSRLPAPSVSGSTATYHDVLPGVDLVVTATDLGGLSEVLAVHDAAAAADPRLDSLSFGLAAHGLTVRDDGHGNLSATDAHGRTAYTSPAATMWDSSTAAGAAPSTVAGPGGHARMATLPVTAAAGHLSLRPDRSLLRGAGTRYPVYIDPTWNPNYASVSEQAFDEIQQGCPTTSNYNSTTYGEPGVGLNDFSGCIGKERSFFRVGIPSSVWGTHIVTATVNTIETYSASCSASGSVALWSTGGISSSTTWNHAPSLNSDVTSASVGPACSSSPTAGFTVTSVAASAAAGHWSSWTFALIGNENSDIYLKRFKHNPTLQIEYNHVPAVPTSLAAAAGSAGVGCATSTPYPWMGSTAGVTPPTMQAKVSDGDGGQVQGTFSYWVDGTSTKHSLTSTVTSGGTAKVSLPSSFVTGLATGQVVDWQAQATDGKDTSAWSSVCHFGVDLTAPPAPTIATKDGKFPASSTGQTGAAAGVTGQFTLSVSSGASASTFVYQLDTVPPTSNPPASMKVTATANTATVSSTPLAPGTHSLWTYALDQAGNESGLASFTFMVAGHAGVTYPSLAAAFNNVAISADTAQSAANADGIGYSLSAQDLIAAGWQPGGKVTVDGATFTLPAFGSGQADNVLAANQTITMPSGTHGSALVFLATSTNGFAQTPDGIDGDVTAPSVAAGTGVTGTGCTFVNGATPECQPASGALTYGDGAPAQSYYLTVPDWTAGPRDETVVQLPHRNSSYYGQVAGNPKIYAYSVPLNPSASVTSVTLPDISSAVTQTNMPGLHIFGIAVRDTTTAPGGAAWTGAWSAPNEAAFNYLGGANYADQTFRIAATPSVAGSSVRIRLSDALGVNPLTIDHVTVSTQGAGAASTGTPTNLTFGGAAGTTIPIGGEIYSDPITFPVTTGQALMVSIHLVNSLTYLVQHSWAADTYMWVTPPGSGDHTADTAAAEFTATGSHYGYFADILTGVDVTAPANPGTVAVLGNNLTLPTGTGMTAVGGARKQISTDLAAALRGNTQGVPDFGVVEGGIENNGVLRDVVGNAGGLNAMSRLDRDILAEPGIGTVVVTEGLTDLLNGTSADDLTDAYTELATQLNAFGVSVVFVSLTPCDGYAPCTTAVDTQRLTANNWLDGQITYLAPYISSVDASATVGIDDPNSTTTPLEQKLDNGAAPADADAGDHVNLSNDGYAAITVAIPLTDLVANTPPQY